MSNLIHRLSNLFQKDSNQTVPQKKKRLSARKPALLVHEPESIKIKRRSFVLRQFRKAQERRAKKMPFTDITNRRKAMLKQERKKRKNGKKHQMIGISSKDADLHLTHSRISQLQDQINDHTLDLMYDHLPHRKRSSLHHSKQHRLLTDDDIEALFMSDL